MEQLLALSPVLCIVLLIPTWAAEIPAGCKRVQIPNVGASAQKPAGLGVSQEPRSLNMTAGENMTLSCTFQTRDSKRTKVLWLRGSGEDLELNFNHPFYRGRLRVSSLDEHRQGKATLTLAELQERDSGLYQCCIELDRGETGMGGGTELRVMRRNQSATDDRKESKRDTSTELTIYRATIALAGVSIILLVTNLLLRGRKGIYSSSRAHSICPFFLHSKCTSLPSHWCKGEWEPPIYILQSSVQFVHLHSSPRTTTHASFFLPRHPTPAAGKGGQQSWW
ncbi:uncharacterized protein LOC144274684 isoform X2 [Eretmochelys imbricata]